MKTTFLIKRATDILLSVVALIILAPVFLITAVAIKLEDGGSVIYKQERVGLNKKKIWIYKFRSMVINANEIHEQLKKEYGVTDISFKVENDPRITKVGKFIRRTCIDELPQLINILKGDMSIVGPRPLPVYEFESQQDVYGTKYDMRYQVPQGLTCIWQVSDREKIDFEERMQMDCRYANEQCIVKDISLIFQTVGAIIRGSGTY